MQVWRERTFRATVVLLVASVVLIVPGSAGIDASVPFLGLFGVLAVALALARPLFSGFPTVAGQDFGIYGRDLWLAPLVGAVVVIAVAPDASAAELQALGGAVGFVGMVNYFIRPVYFWLAGLARRFLPVSDSTAPDESRPSDSPGENRRSQSPVEDRRSPDSRESRVDPAHDERVDESEQTERSGNPEGAGPSDVSERVDFGRAGEGDSPQSAGNQE